MFSRHRNARVVHRLAIRRSAHLSAFALAILILSAGLVAPAASAEEPATVPASVSSEGRIVISEVAAGSSRSDADSFFELQNIDDHAVDLTGWQVFRCSAQGLRANYSRPESEMKGLVLEPGEIAVVTRIGVETGGVQPDGLFTQQYAPSGFGLILADASGATADAIGVYPTEPWPTESECSEHGNVPASLAFALDESWQRVRDTGDVAVDFVRARATPGSAALGRVTTPSGAVVIDEIAAAGPDGSSDDVIELRNPGTETIDLSGWVLYRCARDGSLSAGTAQVTFPALTNLAAGKRVVVSSDGGAPGAVPDRTAVFASATSLADTISGAVLVDAAGRRVDGVTVSNHPDTACQTGDEKLASILDYRSGESWQRSPATGEWLIAARTPGSMNERTDTRLAAEALAYSSIPAVAISEIATDPWIDQATADAGRHNFVELGNYGDRAVDVGGWRLVACGDNGFRDPDDLTVIAAGTLIEPGETWVAALEGTGAAGDADARFTTPLDFQGAGVWVEDASGERVDSVGIFHANEMDHSVERYSPCTKGMSLSTFAVDRLAGETWQRARFTGSDTDDFVHATASPGALDERTWIEAGELTPAAAGRVAAVTRAQTHIESISTDARGAATRPAITGAAATIVEAFTGATEGGVLAERSAPGEQRVAGGGLAAARDDAWAYPYVRLRVAVPGASDVVSWAGSATGAAPVRLSVWAPDASAWRTLDEADAADEGGTHDVVLSGELRAGEAPGGIAELLVQAVPSAPAADRTGFADPDDYDLAVAHITDTQYLSESYPEVYAEQLAWVRASQQERKISFVAHTGDLIQNWVDPDQQDARARHEFEVASVTQATLDDAGIANSVLPGNHDNKRGVTNDLFNEYFGPERYADAPWYGGSIAPDDNSANYTLFERAGARFLVLSLPYGYAERELEWAETVVAEHPDRNVIVATHEHLSATDDFNPPARSTGSRWLSRADELWQRVVAPNRNVVLVLAGHFHGLSRIDTTDAGGIPGHSVTELLADYQEFRTHTGERATGFQRLLQIDLAGGTVQVDTFSATLGEHASFAYDYEQAVADNGHDTSGSNARPWRILEHGLQHRYTAADDDFSVRLSFQFDKAVQTSAVTTSAQ
ncbi:MAG: lamin tail domain-containing protein [Microbacterium sp.]|uniref:lamin tail domain-containing protein n=1 Tax=Microbacterium sp. TaxID=51671 RepID=UPI002727CD5C|nr:lamin tail domain-containing protein [Microbacterium sp.]MDO8382473.1 lamin tail domain-containing protein [Microbacterium sp.]